MQEMRAPIAEETVGLSNCRGNRPPSWTMTAAAEPIEASAFEAVLLAIAAHDLRQPLQLVQSSYERLGLGVRTKSELHLLQVGKNAARRLADQLNQLVGALLLHEQTKAIELTPVQVGPLLHQASRDCEEMACRAQVSIRVVPTSSSVLSNDVLLGTTLANLVSNAVKYTRPGGKVLIGCRRVGQNTRIDVFDTGNGIAREDIPRLFEAFTRVQPTQQDGLGVGLFIVRQALRILGHRIEVDSVADQGSRFSIFATRTGA